MKNSANWAYGAYTMNNADLGIGTVYYAAAYFDVKEGEPITMFNPNTGAVYTAEEIRKIVTGIEDDAKYVRDIPEAAVMGISTNGTDRIFWYDAQNAKNILSHTDALILNAETGTLMTTNADNVAVPMA